MKIEENYCKDLEAEKALQGNEAEPIDAVKDGVYEYRVFEHPLLANRIIKNGFSWPAMIIGPAWLLFRRLWAVAAILVVCSLAVRYWTLGLRENLDSSDLALVDVAFLLVVNYLVAISANTLWQHDLLRRGYVLVNIVEARSLDEARAILHRAS